MLLCVVVCCCVLLCVVVCCCVLLCVVVCCCVLLLCVVVCCSCVVVVVLLLCGVVVLLSCVVVCCRVLLCVVVCCRVLLCIVVCCFFFFDERRVSISQNEESPPLKKNDTRGGPHALRVSARQNRSAPGPTGTKQKTSRPHNLGHWTNVCATRVLLHLEVLREGPSPWHSPARTRIGPFPQTIVRPLQRRGPPAELARRPLLTLGKSTLSFFVPASVLPQVSRRLPSVRLEASPVEDVVHTQVHVADERVSAHARACLTTYSCRR